MQLFKHGTHPGTAKRLWRAAQAYFANKTAGKPVT
jgi:hypothetical protein